MKIIFVVLVMFISMVIQENSIVPANQQVTFTIIYDNYPSEEPFLADWGFSCLIEGKDKTILFDTGTKPEILKQNMETLGIDIDKIDLIVISHNHGDHTGGLPVILEKRRDLPLYIPISVEEQFLRLYPDYEGYTVAVDKPIQLCEGVMLTGEMGDMIKEQSLLIETEKGLVIVTGCSHQGVENIVKKATQLSDMKIYLLFGGFHLLNHTESQIREIVDIFLKEGVQKCGATHCTGDLATKMLKKVYGENFMTMGAGKRIVI